LASEAVGAVLGGSSFRSGRARFPSVLRRFEIGVDVHAADQRPRAFLHSWDAPRTEQVVDAATVTPKKLRRLADRQELRLGLSGCLGFAPCELRLDLDADELAKRVQRVRR